MHGPVTARKGEPKGSTIAHQPTITQPHSHGGTSHASVWVRINATVKQQGSKHQKPKGQNYTNINGLSLKEDLTLRDDADK